MPEQNEQPKQEYNETEFPADRIAFYEGRAQEILDANSREFHEFIKGHERLEEEGNKLICLEKGMGYNIILAERDMPLTSKRDLIFYNNYIGRPHHFGLLLANMETKGIITPGIVRFGKKATKVLYDGSWDLDPKDEFEETISYTDETGIVSHKNVYRTVETVVIFSPRSKMQAAEIASFLVKNTEKRDVFGHIHGSWKVPDIRATVSLAKVLIQPGMTDFRLVIANVWEKNGAQLIVLRQKTKFDQENQKKIGGVFWKSKGSTQNEKLAHYLASQDFNVLP